MHRTEPEFIDVNPEQLEELLCRAEQSLDPADYDLVKAICHSYTHLVGLVEDRGTSIKRLHQLLFGHRTEKTANIIGDPAKEAEASASASEPTSSVADSTGNDETHDGTSGEKAKRKPGHGRNAADAYEGGEQIEVAHATLSAGDPCPECEQGTLYDFPPGVIVRIVGRAPLHSRVYRLQKLRCGLCGELFTAEPPREVGERKYDATAASMIALLRYGSGLPFNRLEGLQRNLKIPLPASTQWEIVEAYSRTVMPIWRELIVQAAQGEVLHHDDTTVKILDLMTERAGQTDEESGGERRGLYTSGVVSLKGDHWVALFFSGRKHAGENLVDVLKERAEELSRPIQMCDALSRNMPGELKTIVANCLAHARRNFVEIHDRFPAECEYVLRAFEGVYANDATAREENLSASERLALHQTQSEPEMTELRKWLDEQLDQRKVEPNSALGEAMGYLRRHWEKLTVFLRKAGAPLDNNICERALKKAILHRKNSLFYKSRNGASVGDMYMSVIHSCELNGVNPLDYLVELDHHAAEVASDATQWMPWNYQATLLSL